MGCGGSSLLISNYQWRKKRNEKKKNSKIPASEAISGAFPNNVLFDCILPRLPAPSLHLHRFKCVSKSWCSAIESEYFWKLHQEYSSRNSRLVIRENNASRSLRVYDITYKENQLIPIEIPNNDFTPLISDFGCRDLFIMSSRDNMICLWYSQEPSEYSHYLFDIFSGNIRPIHRLKELMPRRCWIELLSDPTSGKYKLLCISDRSVWVATVEAEEDQVCQWRSITMKSHIQRLLLVGTHDYKTIQICPQVFGSLFWVDMESHPARHGTHHTVIAFDITMERFSTIAVPPVRKVHGKSCNCMHDCVINAGLAGSAQGLNLFYFYTLNFEVWMLKEYHPKKPVSWSKRCALGLEFWPKEIAFRIEVVGVFGEQVLLTTRSRDLYYFYHLRHNKFSYMRSVEGLFRGERCVQYHAKNNWHQYICPIEVQKKFQIKHRFSWEPNFSQLFLRFPQTWSLKTILPRTCSCNGL